MTKMTKLSPMLEACELFADLSYSAREVVVSMGRYRDFMSDEMLFLEGDAITETFLLTEGRVKTSLLSPDGTEAILRFTNPGELVGEPSLGFGNTHHVQALAIQASEVLVWEAEAFESALERYPILQSNVTGILQQRIRQMEERLCEVSTQMASQRLAHSLTRLADQIGHKTDSHVEINISQEQLSRLAAISPFTVNRLLGDWEIQGVLKSHRECIEVQNFLQLAKLCKVNSPTK